MYMVITAYDNPNVRCTIKYLLLYIQIEFCTSKYGGGRNNGKIEKVSQ